MATGRIRRSSPVRICARRCRETTCGSRSSRRARSWRCAPWAGRRFSRTRSFGLLHRAARRFFADRLEVIASLADRRRETDALYENGADRAHMRGLVGDREVRVAELAARRIDDDVRGHAAPGERKDRLAIHVAASSHAQFALDAPIEVEQHVGMRPVHWAARAKLDETRRHHLAAVSERLQLAIAALLAAGTEVVALNEGRRRDFDG